MAESEIKTIRLELPYVKISPSEDPGKFEIYNSAGLFFIELPNGDFQVADVVGENLGVGLWGVPPSLNNFISKLLARKEQEEKESLVLKTLDNIAKMLDDRLVELDDQVACLMEMKKESNNTLSNMLLDSNATMGEIREQNSQIRKLLEKFGETKNNTPEGGYVTEKTLLDIISSVRK